MILLKIKAKLILIKSALKYGLFVVLLSLILGSCNDNVQSSIPIFPVYLELNLATTYTTFKDNINESLTFVKRINEIDRIGFGGILVYVGFDGQYYAFDMCCPYEAEQNVRVYPNDIGQAVCEKCSSVFDIGYGIGNPSSGLAKEVLKRYRAALSGNILLITNR